MSADAIGERTDGRVGDRVNKPAEARDKSIRNEGTVYGDEAAWTSVVWAVIGILSACGLAALLFARWAERGIP